MSKDKQEELKAWKCNGCDEACFAQIAGGVIKPDVCLYGFDDVNISWDEDDTRQEDAEVKKLRTENKKIEESRSGIIIAEYKSTVKMLSEIEKLEAEVKRLKTALERYTGLVKEYDLDDDGDLLSEMESFLYDFDKEGN